MSGELMKPIKVPVTQLRQGMMIVAPPSSWITDPFVYGKSGIIKSVEEISHIMLYAHSSKNDGKLFIRIIT